MQDYENQQATQLQELGGSDFEIRDGEPDIRGWTVYSGNDARIGQVTELLFAPAEGKIRYLVVDIDSNDWGIEADRCVLIPIGVAELHPEDDDVRIPLIAADQLAVLPEYKSGYLSPGMEDEIRTIFSGSAINPTDRAGFYAHEHFDEDKFYHSRGPFGDGNRVTRNNQITPAGTTLPGDEANAYVGQPAKGPDHSQPALSQLDESSNNRGDEPEIRHGARAGSSDLGYKDQDQDEQNPGDQPNDRGVRFP